MASGSAGRPNVLVFLTDQQRWDTTGLHGNPCGLTPNFDRMAQRGTHLWHCFTNQPICGPARACIQSGMYGTATGCFVNGVPLPPEVPALGRLFRDAGYATGYIGKWHLGSHEPVPEGQRGGYDYWLAANLLEDTSMPYHTIVYDGSNQAVKLPGYRVDALTDAAVRYVDVHQHEPFFLFLSFMEPHQQNQLDDYVAPDGYRERYYGAWMPPDLAALGGSAHQHLPGYYGMVKRLDENLGRLLDVLKSLELTEKTIVLFASDHGCHFKTRNSVASCAYKCSPHESSIRIPAAIQGPGFDGGGQVRELVSLVDIAPTLLDAVRLPIPPVMQGRSIVPLLATTTKGSDGWPPSILVQVSHSQVGRALRTKRWKYAMVAPHGNPHRDAAASQYTETELYDLDSDPYELANLIEFTSHREIAAALRSLMERKMVEAGENAPVIEVAPQSRNSVRRVRAEEVAELRHLGGVS